MRRFKQESPILKNGEKGEGMKSYLNLVARGLYYKILQIRNTK